MLNGMGSDDAISSRANNLWTKLNDYADNFRFLVWGYGDSVSESEMSWVTPAVSISVVQVTNNSNSTVSDLDSSHSGFVGCRFIGFGNVLPVANERSVSLSSSSAASESTAWIEGPQSPSIEIVPSLFPTQMTSCTYEETATPEPSELESNRKGPSSTSTPSFNLFSSKASNRQLRGKSTSSSNKMPTNPGQHRYKIVEEVNEVYETPDETRNVVRVVIAACNSNSTCTEEEGEEGNEGETQKQRIVRRFERLRNGLQSKLWNGDNTGKESKIGALRDDQSRSHVTASTANDSDTIESDFIGKVKKLQTAKTSKQIISIENDQSHTKNSGANDYEVRESVKLQAAVDTRNGVFEMQALNESNATTKETDFGQQRLPCISDKESSLDYNICEKILNKSECSQDLADASGSKMIGTKPDKTELVRNEGSGILLSNDETKASPTVMDLPCQPYEVPRTRKLRITRKLAGKALLAAREKLKQTIGFKGPADRLDGSTSGESSVTGHQDERSCNYYETTHGQRHEILEGLEINEALFGSIDADMGIEIVAPSNIQLSFSASEGMSMQHSSHKESSKTSSASEHEIFLNEQVTRTGAIFDPHAASSIPESRRSDLRAAMVVRDESSDCRDTRSQSKLEAAAAGNADKRPSEEGLDLSVLNDKGNLARMESEPFDSQGIQRETKEVGQPSKSQEDGSCLPQMHAPTPAETQLQRAEAEANTQPRLSIDDDVVAAESEVSEKPQKAVATNTIQQTSTSATNANTCKAIIQQDDDPQNDKVARLVDFLRTNSTSLSRENVTEQVSAEHTKNLNYLLSETFGSGIEFTESQNAEVIRLLSPIVKNDNKRFRFHLFTAAAKLVKKMKSEKRLLSESNEAPSEVPRQFYEHNLSGHDVANQQIGTDPERSADQITRQIDEINCQSESRDDAGDDRMAGLQKTQRIDADQQQQEHDLNQQEPRSKKLFFRRRSVKINQSTRASHDVVNTSKHSTSVNESSKIMPTREESGVFNVSSNSSVAFDIAKSDRIPKSEMRLCEDEVTCIEKDGKCLHSQSQVLDEGISNRLEDLHPSLLVEVSEGSGIEVAEAREVSAFHDDLSQFGEVSAFHDDLRQFGKFDSTVSGNNSTVTAQSAESEDIQTSSAPTLGQLLLFLTTPVTERLRKKNENTQLPVQGRSLSSGTHIDAEIDKIEMLGGMNTNQEGEPTQLDPERLEERLVETEDAGSSKGDDEVIADRRSHGLLGKLKQMRVSRKDRKTIARSLIHGPSFATKQKGFHTHRDCSTVTVSDGKEVSSSASLSCETVITIARS